MKFEKISQEDREKLERRLYKTIVEEFRREKIKDGYYKYIVSLQEFKFITDITDNELKESISIAVDTMEELKKINNNDGMNKKKLKEIQDKEVKYECTISKCSRDRKKHKKIKGRKRDYSKGTSENLWL